MLQIGKMYLVKKLFWLLFPTKEMADDWWLGSCRSGAMGAYQAAKGLSERYSCNVAVVEPNTCFVLLEQQDEAYFKVLDSNGNIGWIVCGDFSKYFEIVKE